MCRCALFIPEPAAVRGALRFASRGQAAPSRRIRPLIKPRRANIKLEPDRKKLVVPLTWTDGQGVTVTKIFTFKPGSYQRRPELRRR